MGATKGYHPISLHVIRGAADYCGWTIGKIVKLSEDIDNQKASYRILIDKGPARCDDWPPKVYRRQLQHCFMDDIRVKDVDLSTRGTAIATLEVQLNRSPLDEALAGVSNDEN